MSEEMKNPFRKGVSDAVAVMIGYIPVSMAFGMTAISAGLPEWLPPFMSILMFAGATQFVMLAAIIKGGTLAWTVGLCALMDSRHLFYAPTIEKLVPMPLKKRILGSFCMTDEVFAMACSKAKDVPENSRTPWYFGLALGSYFSWCFGSFLGVLVGGWVEKNLSFMTSALPFAFPALFFILLYLNLNKEMLAPVLITFAITSILCLLASSGLAIIVGAFCGMAYYYLTQRNVK